MIIVIPEDSADAARIDDASANSEGFVMNLTRAWAWRPEVFDGFGASFATHGQLVLEQAGTGGDGVRRRFGTGRLLLFARLGQDAGCSGRRQSAPQ